VEIVITQAAKVANTSTQSIAVKIASQAVPLAHLQLSAYSVSKASFLNLAIATTTQLVQSANSLVRIRSARIVKQAVALAPRTQLALLVPQGCSSTTRIAITPIALINNSSTITLSNANPVNQAVHSAHQRQTVLSALPDYSFRMGTATTQPAHLAHTSTHQSILARNARLDAVFAPIAPPVPTAPVAISLMLTESALLAQQALPMISTYRDA
jgi:hypothetical protein